jgi:hypothetical protein
MQNHRSLGRIFAAASVGLLSVAACAGASNANAVQSAQAWTPDPAETAAAASDAGAPRCPYGELNDPQKGFVRCLLPEERDAGWQPPPRDAPAEPAKPEPPKAEPPTDAGVSAPPPVVEIGAPKFENGEVTKVEKSLGKHTGDIAKCVADHGGLSGESGSLKVQFLVRVRGRAEGVEVLSAKGVSAEASACVRQALKNKAIGAPTADPVGVTVIITLRAAK